MADQIQMGLVLLQVKECCSGTVYTSHCIWRLVRIICLKLRSSTCFYLHVGREMVRYQKRSRHLTVQRTVRHLVGRVPQIAHHHHYRLSWPVLWHSCDLRNPLYDNVQQQAAVRANLSWDTFPPEKRGHCINCGAQR